MTTRLVDGATFIEWASMTPHQQADHLVYVHGLDADYFTGGPQQFADNAAVVLAFIEPLVTDDNDGYSFPHPIGRDGWHDRDHLEDGMTESGICVHTHDNTERTAP